MNLSRTEAIKRFLIAKATPELARLYNHDMECQVNVAQDGGERVQGDYKGRNWQGWSDGLTTWKPFRIPYQAKTEPHYDDPPMNYDLAAHVEGIGMTGWDWKALKSRWVAYDFDSIIGHSSAHRATLTAAELFAIQESLKSIPWVTIRKSTSGNGLHIYVYLDLELMINNHTEHAALARSILGQMAAITGQNLTAKVDICGGNMWVWHRKSVGTDGFTLIKQGDILREVPENWRDHLKVVAGSSRRRIPKIIEELGKVEPFEELVGQHPRVALDDQHKLLLKYLQDENLAWEWDQDNHMLITHTIAMKQAHQALQLKGYYETSSRGSSSVNCFAFPNRKGAWVIRRYSPGVAEHPSWQQDGAGWTKCHFNREPDLATICRAMGAIENQKGGFVFREAEVAQRAALFLGVDIKVSAAMQNRQTILRIHKDGRLIVEIERKDEDRGDYAEGFLSDKKSWTRIYNTKSTESLDAEGVVYDDLVRHLVAISDTDAGWVLFSDGKWHFEPLTHVKAALAAAGLIPKELSQAIGGSVFKPWRLVNKPFQPEYPGDREWNLRSAQLRYSPSQEDDLKYPTWTKILNHSGSGLDESIKHDPWCRANGITTGGDYLKCWIASVIQEPAQPLPYLFFYNEQQSTGKSIFHEAIKLLFTRGVEKAESALTNQQGFNGELAGAVVCTVEEVDLSQSKVAYNRVKDWVTGRDILIHPKGETPYSQVNTTHWIQCANPLAACPVFPGDTRVTVCYVKALDPLEMIPKKRLIPMLESEAPAFLGELMRLELPPSEDRLNLPPIATGDKAVAETLNLNTLEAFINEYCKPMPGSVIKFTEFYERFVGTCFQGDETKWSKIRVGRSLPRQYPKGRMTNDANFHIANIAWMTDPDNPKKPYFLEGEFLRQRGE